MSTTINCSFEVCTETSTAHLVDDIVAVYDDKTEPVTVMPSARPNKVNRRPKNQQSPGMKRASYVHIASIPAGNADIVRQLTDSMFHPPSNPDDPHSGGVKWIRRYKIDVATFVVERNPHVVSDQIITDWDEVKPYVIDRETDQPVEFVTIGGRVVLQGTGGNGR